MRAEHVTLSKEVVVRERVVVRRHPVEEVARVEARVLREVLRTSQSGAVDIVEQGTEKVPLTGPAINGIHLTKGD